MADSNTGEVRTTTTTTDAEKSTDNLKTAERLSAFFNEDFEKDVTKVESYFVKNAKGDYDSIKGYETLPNGHKQEYILKLSDIEANTVRTICSKIKAGRPGTKFLQIEAINALLKGSPAFNSCHNKKLGRLVMRFIGVIVAVSEKSRIELDKGVGKGIVYDFYKSVSSIVKDNLSDKHSDILPPEQGTKYAALY
jgi:hypothetical protein